jgi:protein gp37
MAAYLAALDPRTARRWREKLWLIFSAENQYWFDRRWGDLRPFAEAGWFVGASLSPLLGAITLPEDFLRLGKWIIVNGECEKITPDECRPMDPDWACALLAQGRAHQIAFFVRAMH